MKDAFERFSVNMKSVCLYFSKSDSSHEVLIFRSTDDTFPHIVAERGGTVFEETIIRIHFME
jgi:hypothetical protein